MGAYKWFMKTQFGGPSYVTKTLQTENRQKVDNFELIYPNRYQFWWKMIYNF